MSDLISRQVAINALNDEYHGMISDESMKIYQIINWLNDLPSAQPETHEERTETHACDLISRKAAIDALIAEGRNVDSRYLESERIIHESDAVEVISMLPSAQPEPCEDAVSRKAVEEMLKNGFPARGMWEIEGDVVKQTICETLADALMDLERLPSAQPEIVRCNDCKHWREGTVYSYCDKLYGMGVLDVYDYMTA